MSNLTQPAEYYARQLLTLLIQYHFGCACDGAYSVAEGLASEAMTLDDAIDVFQSCERR